ncbi:MULTISPECIES: PDR/VanB family oxidoreductase [unclassified Acinetobacter]|uniref:PDR/VanB family oxidoreductase n=1 Tax=unclassified Acinetobacter TaxID=196816 RepID=UPI00293429B7|nr:MULTISPECIES: PDR/VanB family oxidoreductase [unclassified Acinetobacter]WOE32456.1 PDR/VanB family oxidoreductase [Acinetobacter sp. SAAs470]WOE37931.1 PDR/VanB family oxidoreductase [Acinetobacter sp. SAAs474]
MSNTLSVCVTHIEQVTPMIREFTLTAQHQPLLPFSSGSHIVVQLPLKDRVIHNAYSLLNDPDEQHHYQIAVRLQDKSRGGSQYLHQHVQVGDSLDISAPLNLFALHSQAKHHVFIAGGIGITPFLSHMKYLLHAGDSFELHYACRDGISNAYELMLKQLFDEHVHIYSEKTQQRLDIEKLLKQQSLQSHVYICGPERLIGTVVNTAQQLGWSRHRVHWEKFTAPAAGEAFDVLLTQSQRKIHIPSNFSLLEALEQHGIAIPNLCRGGVCGQCSTAYTQGEVAHLDHYLTVQEQASQLMPCVSRAKSGHILHLAL